MRFISNKEQQRFWIQSISHHNK